MRMSRLTYGSEDGRSIGCGYPPGVRARSQSMGAFVQGFHMTVFRLEEFGDEFQAVSYLD